MGIRCLAVRVELGIKIKESEKIDKYLHITRYPHKETFSMMRLVVMSIVVSVRGTVSKGLQFVELDITKN